MKSGFVEVPNRYITRKTNDTYIINKDLSYKARILLIGIVDYSKKYGYCNYSNQELEELISIDDVSRLIKELEEYKYIRVSIAEHENTRSIIPNFFYSVNFSNSEEIEKTVKKFYKDKLKENGFTPVPKAILFNQGISCKAKLIYSYFLMLVNSNRERKNHCYPPYSTINKMLGLSAKSKTIKTSIEELESIRINENKILFKEVKGNGRGYIYYPLCRVLKVDDKYKVLFLDEEDFKIKEVEQTREELLEEIEILKDILLAEDIRIIKDEEGNRYKLKFTDISEREDFLTLSDKELLEVCKNNDYEITRLDL